MLSTIKKNLLCVLGYGNKATPFRDRPTTTPMLPYRSRVPTTCARPLLDGQHHSHWHAILVDNDVMHCAPSAVHQPMLDTQVLIHHHLHAHTQCQLRQKPHGIFVALIMLPNPCISIRCMHHQAGRPALNHRLSCLRVDLVSHFLGAHQTGGICKAVNLTTAFNGSFAAMLPQPSVVLLIGFSVSQCQLHISELLMPPTFTFAPLNCFQVEHIALFAHMFIGFEPLSVPMLHTNFPITGMVCRARLVVAFAIRGRALVFALCPTKAALIFHRWKLPVVTKEYHIEPPKWLLEIASAMAHHVVNLT